MKIPYQVCYTPMCKLDNVPIQTNSPRCPECNGTCVGFLNAISNQPAPHPVSYPQWYGFSNGQWHHNNLPPGGPPYISQNHYPYGNSVQTCAWNNAAQQNQNAEYYQFHGYGALQHQEAYQPNTSGQILPNTGVHQLPQNSGYDYSHPNWGHQPSFPQVGPHSHGIGHPGTGSQPDPRPRNVGHQEMSSQNQNSHPSPSSAPLPAANTPSCDTKNAQVQNRSGKASDPTGYEEPANVRRKRKRNANSRSTSNTKRRADSLQSGISRPRRRVRRRRKGGRGTLALGNYQAEPKFSVQDTIPHLRTTSPWNPASHSENAGRIQIARKRLGGSHHHQDHRSKK